MNRILLLFSCIAGFFQSYAQNLNTNAVQGSLLCDEKVLRITEIPDTFKIHGFVRKEIQTISNKLITISYFFERISGKVLRNDTSSLNGYFTYEKQLSLIPDPNWRISEYFYIDNKVIDSVVNLHANPYSPCYNFKSTNCKELKVYRNSIRQICPDVQTRIIDRSNVFRKDTLEAVFVDTIINQSSVCLAIGWRHQVDSVVVSGLPSKSIPVAYRSVVKRYVVCVRAPCPNEFETKGFIGTANLNELCLVNGYSKTEESDFRSLIYPNPASGIVNLPESVNSITITDIKGQQHIIKGSGSISLGPLDPGIYAVTYTIDEKVFTERLVIY